MTEAWFGLFGVILGSIIAISKDSWAHWRERRLDGSYSAIRLICILEEYANKCIDVAGDDGYAYGRPAGQTDDGQEYCVAQITTPDPLDYPSDIAWRSLDETLMHRILALPNKSRSTNRYVSASAENAFMPYNEEFFEPRQEGYAQLGLEALDIVDDLRNRHGISVKSRTDLSEGWDSKEYLAELIAKFKKRDTEREERRKAILAKSTLKAPTVEEVSR
ncbi:hypothetical protein [Planktotalea sp.]|uniref:hypothetical protein n=1 Tax=Planktotalea sp. TaxID=2029877 RepID=UPI003297B7A5